MNSVQIKLDMKIIYKRCLCDGQHHPNDNTFIGFISQDFSSAKGCESDEFDSDKDTRQSKIAK